MRIAGWRVDGFGVLSDEVALDIPPGLTIVEGPNEAGKSTLLEFICQVLFGFPDRRRREGARPPVRGGRHGGAVTIVDDGGGTWILERHADAREPVLTAPNGTAAGDVELSDLLGHADATLFQAVFAFGLGELASLASLETDEVRDHLFSAGVLGAGRSATRAIRALEQRQARLARPRQQDARANALYVRLVAVDESLRDARRRSTRYGDVEADLRRLDDELLSARRGQEAGRRRTEDLERLIASWPAWVRKQECAHQLRDLGEQSGHDRRLLDKEGLIRTLCAARSGRTERGGRQEELVGELEGLTASSTERQRALEVLLGAPLPAEAAPSRELAEVARALAAEANSLAGLLEERRLGLQRASRVATDAEGDATERASASGPLDEDDVLAERERALRHLRARMTERDRLGERVAEAARNQALAALVGPRSDPAVLGRRRLLVIVLGCLAAALGALGALAVTARHLGEGAGTLACGAALLAVAITVHLAGRGHRRGEASAPASPEGPSVEEEELGRAEMGVSSLAASLGLDDRSSDADLEAALDRCSSDRGLRRQVEELERSARRARDEVASSGEALEEAVARQDALRVRLDRLCAGAGMPLGMGTELAASAFDQVVALREREQAADRIRRALGELAEVVEGHDQSVLELADAIEPGSAPPGDTDAVIEELERQLGVALATDQERRALRSRHDEAEEALVALLGSAEDADRLRDELASGERLAWEREMRTVREALDGLEAERDEIFEQRSVARRTLDDLLSSGEIAALELDREGIARELDEALGSWATLGLAKTLLERTLARYEQDRQPRVIQRAGELFKDVTDGRYVQLVARDDGTDGRSRGIEVLAASGGRLDSAHLSRGTAEQLYICLRLALAESFASSATALPIILDDVLVNFDPERAAAIARTVGATARSHQVLAFTCQPHVVELLRDGSPDARVVSLTRR